MLGTARNGDGTKAPAANMPSYWQHFGLEKAPFEEPSHFSVYYPIPKWQEHLNFLHRFYQSDNPLLLLAGGVGCGKSTLLTQFLAQVDEGVQTHLIKGRSKYTVEKLIQTISEAFNVPRVGGETTLYEEMSCQLDFLSEEPTQHLLLIDNAHRLPTETLTALLHLTTSQHAKKISLYIILFAEPFLRRRLHALTEKYQWDFKIPTLLVEPLNSEETRDYLCHRLQKAGLQGQMPLTEAMMDRIYELSAGYPGRINRVAQQILMNVYKSNINCAVKNKPKPRSFIYPMMIALVLVVLGVIAGMSFWVKEHNGDMRTLVQALVQKRIAVRDKSHAIHLVREEQSIIIPVHQTMDEEDTPSYIVPINEKEEELWQRPTRNTVAMIDVEPLHADKSLSESTSPSSDTKISPLKENKASTKSMKTTSSSPSSMKESNVSPVPQKKVTPRKKYISLRETILQNKGGYTIQLMGVRDPHEFRTILSLPHIQKQSVYFHTHRQGENWYILLYGTYRTIDAAKAAIVALPTFVQSQHPWIRTYAAIQKAVDEVH